MKIINLLPKSKQKELQYESLFHSVSTAAIIGVSSLILVVLLQTGLGIYLQRQQSSVTDQIEQTRRLSNKEENAKLKTEIDGVNFKLKDYQDLSNAAPAWSKALRAFVNTVPAEIKISSFVADTANKQIDITGYAPTREQVIGLYNKISDDKEHFHGINYPLENVAKPTEVDFYFTFFVHDAVLQKTVAQGDKK